MSGRCGFGIRNPGISPGKCTGVCLRPKFLRPPVCRDGALVEIVAGDDWVIRVRPGFVICGERLAQIV